MHLLEWTADLSRPVIEIKRFPSGELTHEMFAFGSEIAVVPVSGGSGEGGSPAWRLAAEELKREASRLTGISVLHAKFLTDSSADIFVDDSAVGAMVGPGGDGIRQLEKDMGKIKLNVKSVTELPRALRKRVEKESLGSGRLGRLAQSFRPPVGTHRKEAKRWKKGQTWTPLSSQGFMTPSSVADPMSEGEGKPPVVVVSDSTNITSGTEVQENSSPQHVYFPTY